VARFDKAALRLRVVGGEPHARWLQPGGKIAGGLDTLVALAPAGRDAWTGTVAPVPDRVRFYLTIRPDGTAWVRETERNLGRFLGELRVERHGDQVEFRDERKQVAITARIAGNALQVSVPSRELDLTLTKRRRDTAPGFYARPSSAGRYVYQPPKDRGDGWAVASLDDVGIARASRFALRCRRSSTTRP
jgi:hypothetical protein